MSSPDLLLSVRRLEFLQHLLEISIALVVAGSIAAAALVRTPGHAGVVGGGLLTFGLALARAFVVAGVRQRTGTHVIARHGTGRWLVVHPLAGDRSLGWSIDLRPAALPPGPLLLPGLALVGATLVPTFTRLWPAAGTSAPAWVDSPATLVVALLLLHQAAAAAFAHAPAHRRLRLALPWLVIVLLIVVLVRLANAQAIEATGPGARWPLAWTSLVLWLTGLWLASAALAAARHDRLVLLSVAGLVALAIARAAGPSPHVWAALAVASALGSARGRPEQEHPKGDTEGGLEETE